jgi:diadenosine tetraphosphate (Ap4A) HIT family hydrolase
MSQVHGMSETQIQKEASVVPQHCGVCDVRTAAARESVVYADELWTVTLGMDVPGWFMVMINRHNDDWLWGLSDQEASTLGSLVQRLSAAARAEASAERVYMMGFGEQWQHFHFMLMSRSASTPADYKGAGMLAHAPDLADRDEALRVGSRIRKQLAVAG